MKKLLIAGNWKMNTDLHRAATLASNISERLESLEQLSAITTILFPPFPFLAAVSASVDTSFVKFGAQNCSHEINGAFTGDVSAAMLKSIGCSYVLVGHSERRSIYKEVPSWFALKCRSIIKENMTPIYCIGETAQERRDHKTLEVLRQQLDDVFDCIDASEAKKIIIAYEPVWAIGTGVTPDHNEAEEAHSFIRLHLSKYIAQTEDCIILYGGSMTADSAQVLLEQKNINGGLIGGASLKEESFLSIIEIASSIVKTNRYCL